MDKEFFEMMYRRLNVGLPFYLTYHNVSHTQYVLDKAIYLAKTEGCNEEELRLISVAALYHDAGFLIGMENHEEKGCRLVETELPEYGFSPEEIEKICGMIMATKTPQNPGNVLERILADADLFYLGTDQYFKMSSLLKKELLHLTPSLDEETWKQIQLNFLKIHHFHTDFGKSTLDPIKQKNVELVMAS
ncbi:HD domain-containing protein [Cecembia sp.]|uniref:HD domain-containing protein n=1 Tax=Cecembia sp. TaxID=1898110 RepID=UPI0025B9461A|nr:HD domain-containing protein [Cecembia sp.]